MSRYSGKPLDKTTTRRTLYYYWQATRKHLGCFVGLIVSTLGFCGLLTYANPFFMSQIVNRLSEGSVSAQEVFPTFGPLIVALVIVNVAGQACSKIQDYVAWRLNILVSYDLSTLCFEALSMQSMSFHTNRFGGALVSQTAKFTAAYALLAQSLAFPFLPMLCSIVLTCAFLGPAIPEYTAILMALLVVYATVSYFMYKRILVLNENAAGAQNQLSGELSDAVGNILAVKTYGRESYERELFNIANKEVVARESKRMKATILRGVITACITVVIMSIVAVFMAGGNAWLGITPGTVVLMFTYTYTITNQFNFINAGLMRINQALGDASAMTKILDEPRLVDDKPGAPAMKVSEGAIDFRNIGFSYSDGSSPTEVFDDFSLSIPGGQRVGLVGISGSGKSTLTKLLLRLADIQKGEILIDGQNVADTTQKSLRQSIAYVPQESLLFHRSIAENIAYGRPDATMDEIREAARQANALEFIEALPEGFDTITGERGVKLSGGQRQRIAIARAMLANAPILVLDEATSALDSESEAAVKEAFERLMKGKTTIVVAHRLSTVASLDRIVVLSHGKIVEDGPHSELVAKGGDYGRLWEKQTSAFAPESGAGSNAATRSGGDNHAPESGPAAC